MNKTFARLKLASRLPHHHQCIVLSESDMIKSCTTTGTTVCDDSVGWSGGGVGERETGRLRRGIRFRFGLMLIRFENGVDHTTNAVDDDNLQGGGEGEGQ